MEERNEVLETLEAAAKEENLEVISMLPEVDEEASRTSDTLAIGAGMVLGALAVGGAYLTVKGVKKAASWIGGKFAKKKEEVDEDVSEDSDAIDGEYREVDSDEEPENDGKDKPKKK